LAAPFAYRALVHSTASAARLTRLSADLIIGDLRDRRSVAKAIRGCDAVVHLARGDTDVMRSGLENLLRSAVEEQVGRFVHISSVGVYGDSPPPESRLESAPLKRTTNDYGNEKMVQERRVLRYASRRGLPVVILRPPNVYGPFSWFTQELIAKIRCGKLAIVENGNNPCNLVYVDNLIEAILLALWKPRAVGEVFFVTDFEPVSWERCLLDHAKMINVVVPRITAFKSLPVRRERMIPDSIRILPRVLLSGELRRILREIPVAKAIDSFMYTRFQSLSADLQQRIRLWINGPQRVESLESSNGNIDPLDNLIMAQGRTVAHSSEKAKRLLGYSSPVSYNEGMALTAAWLDYARIV
jgi:nucleoside-diphosphate-sugar epimerase